MYNDLERRKYKRIGEPYMARLRIKQYEGLEIFSAEWDIVALKNLRTGSEFFNYSKNLGWNLSLLVQTIQRIKSMGKKLALHTKIVASVLLMFLNSRKIFGNGNIHGNSQDIQSSHVQYHDIEKK